MATPFDGKKNTKKTPNKQLPGEERFISSGKSVTLIKPGKGAKTASGGKKGK